MYKVNSGLGAQLKPLFVFLLLANKRIKKGKIRQDLQLNNSGYFNSLKFELSYSILAFHLFRVKV